MRRLSPNTRAPLARPLAASEPLPSLTPPTLPLPPPKPSRSLSPLRLAVHLLRRSYGLCSIAPNAAVRSCVACLDTLVNGSGRALSE
jgi:hypothetical protein